MSSLTGSKRTAFTLSLLVMGFAIVASAIVTPAAFAQNATTPSGNVTQGGNMTQGGNATKPTSSEIKSQIVPVQANMTQGGNATTGNATQSGNATKPTSSEIKSQIVPVQANMTMPGMQMPGMQMRGAPIHGSIDVKQAIKNFLADNLNVTLSDAVATAATHVNGTAVEGHLTVAQGFLVYRVIVVNLNSETLYSVIVDAGNGSVLATQSISLAQIMAMHEMMGMHTGMMGMQGGMGGMQGGMMPMHGMASQSNQQTHTGVPA